MIAGTAVTIWCLKFNTLQRPLSLFLFCTLNSLVSHIRTPIIIFIRFAGAFPSPLPKFLSRVAPIWLLMTFISPPIASLSQPTYCICFSFLSHCVPWWMCYIFFPFPFICTSIQTLGSNVIFFPWFHVPLLLFLLCSYLSLFPHYASLCFISIQSKKMALG